MKIDPETEISKIIDVYLRTHRFYKDLIDICTGIRYDKGEHKQL